MHRLRPLSGTRVAITRPVGSGDAFARRVHALGGTPLRLPGSRLRAAADTTAARASLRQALECDLAIFTSPAAVRFARTLCELRGSARLLAPGAGTLAALQRAGCVDAQAPAREDSEGLLALDALAHVHGQHIAIVGAPGGRGLLRCELTARGASVISAHVYRRDPARLDRRHANALLRDVDRPLYVPLSSAQALDNILAALRDDARRALLAGTAVASSDRITRAAHAAGFTRVLRSASAGASTLLAAISDDRR